MRIATVVIVASGGIALLGFLVGLISKALLMSPADPTKRDQRETPQTDKVYGTAAEWMESLNTKGMTVTV